MFTDSRILFFITFMITLKALIFASRNIRENEDDGVFARWKLCFVNFIWTEPKILNSGTA